MPNVSVIIPNYNHARFLEQRFRSVFDQTLNDYEIIYLDDASTDDSNAIAQKFLSTREGSKAFYNTTNSGNPFKQWNRGVREARGDYIWIAESDDYAKPTFLETLVPILDQHPTVGLVYCQSWVVDEHDNVLSSMDEGYVKDLSPDRWKTAYINSGKAECGRWLILKNAIPNASAVLMRRRILESIGGADETMKLCGDWSTWVKMLLVSDVAFTPKHLNYFRTHDASVRHRTVNSTVFLGESYRIAHEILRRVPVEPQVRGWLNAALWGRWCEFLRRPSLGDLPGHCVVLKEARAVDPEFYNRLMTQLRRRFNTYTRNRFKRLLKSARRWSIG